MDEPENLDTEEQGQEQSPSPQTTSPQLPDDPAERAKALEQRLADSEQVRQQLVSETRRLKEYADEQELAKKTWFNKVQEYEIQRGKQKPAPEPDDEDRSFWMHEDGQPKTLFDFASSGITVQQLFKKSGVVTRKELEQQMELRVKQESQKGAAYRQLIDPETGYPELADPNSKLTKEATAIYVELEQQRPDLDETARWELAAGRAARRINHSPKKPDSADLDRQRRQNGQGNVGARTAKAPQPITITDRDRLLAKQLNGGVAVPDDLIKASKEQVAKDNAPRV